MIAADDIGAIDWIAFENPTNFIGKAIEIVEDEQTEYEMADKIVQALNCPIEVVPDDAPPSFSAIAIRNTWFNEKGVGEHRKTAGDIARTY